MWEELGLLYSSEELSEDEKKAFSEHLTQCSKCTEEMKAYQHDKERYFSKEFLEAAPSAKCDAEILRVCSDGRKKMSSFNIFPIFFKKSVISLALFLIGFTVVGYIAFQVDSSKQGTNVSDNGVTSESNATHLADNADAQNTSQSDSAADSSSDSKVNFAKTRGNLNHKGVYPVDLQNK